MATKFICLANSLKEGGRCMAGIELDANQNPVLVNGMPKWIRPVCNTKHGEIPTNLVSRFQLLDIIEIDVTAKRPENYQSENVAFRQNSIRKTGSFNVNQLANLCDNRNLVFGNKGKAVSMESIKSLTHSLVLVNVNQFEITKKIYEDRPDVRQFRIVFTYQANQYDFPITDPAFLDRFYNNPDLLKGVNNAYLTLSLGINWKDWHYKLVAGIIF